MSAAVLDQHECAALGELLANPAGADVGPLREHVRDVAPFVSKLRRLGCAVEPVSVGGYRLARTGLSVWSDYAQHALRETGEARKVQVFRRTASTQDIARRHADEPLLVLADEQSAGRGRLGRTWHAAPGTAVLMSLTHALADGDSPDRVTFAVSVAIAQTVEHLCSRDRVHIKWPNDIVADGRKLGGILVETLTTPAGRRVAIVGVGVNVHVTHDVLAAYPDGVRARVGSLAMLGSAHDRLHVAVEASDRILRHLTTGHERLLLDEWRTRNALHDQRIRLLADGREISGTVIDLDPREGLIVRRDSGELVHLPAATTSVVV